jgi:hypothetical protein
MPTKRRQDKTSSARLPTDGKSAAEPIKASPPPSLNSGDAKIWEAGYAQALRGTYENPQYETYSQRILHRAGWMAGKKSLL